MANPVGTAVVRNSSDGRPYWICLSFGWLRNPAPRKGWLKACK